MVAAARYRYVHARARAKAGDAKSDKLSAAATLTLLSHLRFERAGTHTEFPQADIGVNADVDVNVRMGETNR